MSTSLRFRMSHSNQGGSDDASYRRVSQGGSRRSAEFQRPVFLLAAAAPTVSRYLRHLRAALHWAKKVGMVSTVPDIPFPDGWKRSGGRPLILEEFERMIAFCRKLRGPVSESWESLLWGLWWSGLRIN